MRNVLWHQPLIQRALSSYDARREFGEKERSVRIARSESRAALASIVLSRNKMWSNRGSDFHKTKCKDQNFETETIKCKGKWYFTIMQSQMTSLIPWFYGLYERKFYSPRCSQTLRNSQNIREQRHQIFLLANDWPNPVTWLNMPYLKLGSIREIFPRFQHCARSSKLIVLISLSYALRKLFASRNRSCPRKNFTPDGGYCFYFWWKTYSWADWLLEVIIALTENMPTSTHVYHE